MNVKKLARKIEQHFLSHDITVELVLKNTVLHLQRYIFQLKIKRGTKVGMIFARASDIKFALQLPLFEVFYDNLSICLAVSEKACIQNSLQNMLTSALFRKNEAQLPIALGYDMKGQMFFADLDKLKHMLYAGPTNSGKSVGLINLITSLAVRNPADKLNIIIFDIGANTMDVFKELPHLSFPVVKDTATGVYVVNSLMSEVERRIKLDCNELMGQPKIVCIIDEFLSFINDISDRKESQELENKISKLLQRGRHAGVHMILSTQNPKLKNIKVDISNITARVAFSCARFQNSTTIIGRGGAEKLTGKGTMLYTSGDFPTPVQLQGAFMEENEVKGLVERIKVANSNICSKFVIQEVDDSECPMQVSDISSFSQKDKELADVIMWALSCDTISASKIKDNFSMGNRADDIIDQLYEIGLITKKFAKQPRKVIIKTFSDIPENVVAFLCKNGYTVERISEIFNQEDKASFVETNVEGGHHDITS